MITKIFNRLKYVFILIVEGNDGNELVKSTLGKKNHNLDLSIEQLNNINNDNEDNIADSID